jgi:hypothetical protein
VEDQKIPCEVMGLHDLIYRAIIFDDSLKVKKENQLDIKAEEI